MKTTTTTREYDDQGRMVKETIVETEQPSKAVCGCAVPGVFWCAVHGNIGQRWPGYTITCDSGSNIRPMRGQSFTINSAAYRP